MSTDEKKKDGKAVDAVAETAGPVKVDSAPPAPCKHEKCSCKMAAEFWAKKHGMLEEVFAGGRLELPPEAKLQRTARISLAMSGKIAPRANHKHVHFKAAKLHNNWVTGHELTEAEFLAACEKAYGPKAEVICR